MKGCLRNVVAFGTQAPTAGYQAAFTTTMGKSWAKFVCDFETHHGIPNTVACAKAAAGTETCLKPFESKPDSDPDPDPDH